MSFTTPRKTNYKIKLVPEKETITKQYKNKEGSYTKEYLTGRSTISSFVNYYGYYFEGHMIPLNNGKYKPTDDIKLKLFPDGLGRIIVLSVSNAFTKCFNEHTGFLFDFTSQLTNYNPEDFIFQKDNVPCISGWGQGNFKFEPLVLDKEITGTDIFFETIAKSKLNQDCALYITGPLMRQMFNVLSRSDTFCYPYTRGKPLVKNELTNVIKDLFNEKVKTYKKLRDDYIFLDELPNEVKKVFIEYYSTSSKKRRYEIISTGNVEKFLGRVITLRKLEKYYKRLYTQSEKQTNLKYKEFKKNLELSKDAAENIAYYLAKFSINLTLTMACLNYHKKQNKPFRPKGRKPNGDKPLSEMTREEKKNKEFTDLITSTSKLTKKLRIM